MSSPSSFTSTSDRRRLLALAATLVLAMAAAGALTGLVDPYGRFNGRPAIVSVHGEFANYPLLALVELRRVPSREIASAEVVLVGDSRARLLTKPRSASAEGRAVLNLGVAGGSFDECITTLELLAPELESAKLVIVATPLERCAERVRPNRCFEAKPLADSPLRYLLNWQMCSEALAILRSGGARMPKPRPPLTPEQMQARDERTEATWNEMFHAYQPEVANARLQLLRRVVAPLAARGVKVLFWSPPVRPRIQSLVPKHGLEAAWASTVAELEKVGAVADLSQATRLVDTELTWGDPVHTREHEVVLSWLIRRGLEEPARP